MKVNVTVEMNLKTNEAKEKVSKAAKLAMRDTVVDIWNESVRDTPKLTGHNMRSLTGEVSTMGTVGKGADSKPEKVVDDSKIQGAIYSTSGYGGFLETGTVKMNARPYIKPSADRKAPQFPQRMKEHLDKQ